MQVRKAFTLVELIIVVSILGILAAIVLPEFQGHTKLAKEATAKDNLRVLREAIERYAAEHNGIAPGYNNNSPSTLPTLFFFNQQLITSGKYLNEMPENPLNGKTSVLIVNNENSVPASATGLYGWVYKPSSRTVKLDWTGVDSAGTTFYDY